MQRDESEPYGEGDPLDSVDVPIRAGDVLAGAYQVEHTIGSGGTGVVLSAIHLARGERVAIKLLSTAASTHPDLVARFLREARAAEQIVSDHVARVLDVGRLEDGAPYIAFEYLEGMDLADVITRDGPLSIERAVSYVLEACEGVAKAHALGIVHRDLKPENLFVASRRGKPPIVKVIDFGISKMTSWIGTELSLTRSQTVMGSPRYMAPEQLRAARSVDERSDVWSLGVVLYELLAGRGPFEAETLAELCAAVLKDDPTPLRTLRNDVPADLEVAVARCLRKPPPDRFADVGQLAQAIAPFGGAGAAQSAANVARTLRLAGRGGAETSLVPVAASVRPATSTADSARPRAQTTPTLAGWQRALAAPRTRPLARAGSIIALGIAAGFVAWAVRPALRGHAATSVPRPIAAAALAAVDARATAIAAALDAEARSQAEADAGAGRADATAASQEPRSPRGPKNDAPPRARGRSPRASSPAANGPRSANNVPLYTRD